MHIHTRHIGIAGIKYGLVDAASALLHEDRIVIHSDYYLCAVSCTDNIVLWDIAQERIPPKYFNVPRRIWAHGKHIWLKDNKLVILSHSDEGVYVECYDIISGRRKWLQEFVTPPALPWTEQTPAFEGAKTEEIDAFLLEGDTLAVALSRKSRRTTSWPDNSLPPFHAQLDIKAIELESGDSIWSNSYPNVSVPILEHYRLSSYFEADNQIIILNKATGEIQFNIELKGNLGWPRQYRDSILVPWQTRGKIGVYSINKTTGDIELESQWSMNKVDSLKIWVVGEDVFMRVNDQFVLLLDENLEPLWKLRAKPYVYGIASVPEGPIWIGTSGRGGRLFVYDRNSGSELTNFKLPGGAPDPTLFYNSRYVATSFYQGIAISEVNTFNFEQ